MLAGGWIGSAQATLLVAVVAVLEAVLLGRSGIGRLAALGLAIPLCAAVVVPTTIGLLPASVSHLGFQHTVGEYIVQAFGGLLATGPDYYIQWAFMVGLSTIIWACGYWLGWVAFRERRGAVSYTHLIPILAQLREAWNGVQSTVLALMRVSGDEISRYGCATVGESRGRLHRVTGVVEKPRPEEAQSDLAIMGRYVLSPGIFGALRRTPAGEGGEIQLTDGISTLLKGGEEVWGLEFEGELLDVGTLDGWLTTNVRLARELGRAPALRGALG